MTQDEITLLLTDICGRLKSNLICKVTHKDSEGWKEEDMVLSGIIDDEGYFTSENGSVYSSEFKPYLRPMSSMTEEEANEWAKASNMKFDMEDGFLDAYDAHLSIDWLNVHHFDYRGLIEKGLVLEAPAEMYNISQKWTSLRNGLKENKNGQIVGGVKL